MAKTIKAVFGGGVFARTLKVFEWDTDDKLQFVGIDLPDNYTVDFANSLTGESKPVLGDASGVAIPPEYFVPGTEIYAWVWISTENGGHTKYQVTIPVYKRAKRTGTTPTPAQQDALDQAIEALNAAVTDVQGQINDALQEAKDSGEFDGAPGVGVPTGGTTGQVLAKASGTNYDAEWVDPSGGTTEVFVATYGTTTADEIWQAYVDRKVCILRPDALGVTENVYQLVWCGTVATLGPSGTVMEKKAIFASVNENVVTTIEVTSSRWGSAKTTTLAKLASPTFTGTPKAPTAASGTNTTQIATTAFVQSAVNDEKAVVVTITYDSTNDSYSADKTFAQIKAAVEAGKNVVLQYGNLPTDIYRLETWVSDFGVWANNCGGNADTIMVDNTEQVLRTHLALGTYSKPSGGIPKTDLASAVQTSLGKAGVFTVNITYSNGELVADKSYAEISAAIQAGKTVDVVFAYYHYALESWFGPDSPNAPMVFSQVDHTFNLSTITIESDETVSSTTDALTPTWLLEDELDDKLDKNLGAANAGKFLVVGSNGNITTVTMTAWQGGSY